MSENASRAPASIQVRAVGGAPLPGTAHALDAGLDLPSAEDLDLAPGDRALIGTGLSVALPPGSVGLVCPRSGLASRHGVTVLNAPGIVDAGYRGELKVTLLNTDAAAPFRVRRGDRIAQLVVVEVPPVALVPVDDLPPSERGENGFGSSGGFGTDTAKGT